jgi:hypothetical protein
VHVRSTPESGWCCGDGTGNPAALLTSGAYTAFAYDYDPYGVRALTTDPGGNGTTSLTCSPPASWSCTRAAHCWIGGEVTPRAA